jgi:hypothetical protein
MALVLGGCSSHRVVVTDQVSGLPVQHVQVLVGDHTYHDRGTVAVRLPEDDRLPVTVTADGYAPWTSTVGLLRARRTTAVILDPRWRRDFQRHAPLPVATPVPCPCRTRTR